jgi:hypothetical protein
MMHGIYREDGPEKELRFKGALLRQHPDKPDYFLAQFDALWLPVSHGWHAYPKNVFVNLTGEPG